MLVYGAQSTQSMPLLVVAILFLVINFFIDFFVYNPQSHNYIHLFFGEKFNVSPTAAILAPTIRLSSGYDIPVVGLGTYGPGDIEQAVKDAIDSGYRHIDTAFVYHNEASIAKALNAKIDEGVIKREDIFITTKLASQFHDQVERAFNKSLENLNTTYIDLYLIHSPMSFRRVSKDRTKVDPENIDEIGTFPDVNDFTDVDYLDTWKDMEKLVKSGRVRSIGVSNFNSEQVDRVLSAAEIKPVVNQVECHPELNQRKFIKFLADRNIVLVAYSPLGQPFMSRKEVALNNPNVSELAKKYNKTPAQIILRYTYQNGAIVIPKSTKKKHIQSNIDIFDFSLNDADMQTMHGLNTNHRLAQFAHGSSHKYYPFNLEF